MEDKKAISTVSKLMIVLQGVFLLAVVLFAFFFVPSSQYPYDGAVFSKEGVEFKFRNANAILVDNNEDFNSPKRLELQEFNTNTVLFEPGVYYWKPVGILAGASRMFTIDSTVGLELDEENGTLKNAGNTLLDIDVKDSNGIVGLVVLGIDIEYPVEVKNDTIYMGEEYEE